MYQSVVSSSPRSVRRDHVGQAGRAAGHQQVVGGHRDRRAELRGRGPRVGQRVDRAVADPVDPTDVHAVVEHGHSLDELVAATNGAHSSPAAPGSE